MLYVRLYVHTEYIIRMIKNVKMVEYDKCAAVRVEKNKNTLKGDQSVSRNSIVIWWWSR